jgi:protein-export membrane protein SecD
VISGDPNQAEVDATVPVIESRLKSLGIKKHGIHWDTSRLSIDIPSVEDVVRIAEMLGSPGHLQFRQVLEVLATGDPGYDTTKVTVVNPANEEAYWALEDQEIVLAKEENGNVFKIKLGPTRLPGDIIESAIAEPDKTDGRWMISFTLTDAAAGKFADLTMELWSQTAPLNQLAIVMDYVIKSYPTVNSAITGGKGQITGRFTEQETKDLAMVLNSGSLPVNLEYPPSIEPIK